MLPSNREHLDVLRVKQLYERMVREVTKSRWRVFPVDPATDRGEKNYGYFKKIHDRCKAEAVDISEFMSVLFTMRNFSKGFRWEYPYLNYLASDSAFQLYRDSRNQVDEACLGQGKKYLRGMSPLNLEKHFINGFYNGFTALRGVVDYDGLEKTARPENLFAVYLAYVDLFSLEFVITHSKFPEFIKSAAYLGEDAEIQTAVRIHTAPAVRRVKERPVLFRELMVARRAVATREKTAVQKMFGHQTDWEGVWCLLI